MGKKRQKEHPFHDAVLLEKHFTCLPHSPCQFSSSPDKSFGFRT
uniref:Uncharacterized protein n=1 Tax=Scophthalmus maximus TaxID=52904 RepID=A0A8D3DLP3_SCOMX